MNFKKTWKRFFTVSRASEGFTLVELIVVIAILAILAGIAVPAYSGYIKKANKAADLQLLGAVNTAFAASVLENGDDVNEVPTASMTLTGPDGAKSISVSSIQPARYQGGFERYFAGNNSATFKVIAQLAYQNGVFVDAADADGYNAYTYNGTTVYLSQSDVDALAGSSFQTAGATGLMDQMSTVTTFASGMIEGTNAFNTVVSSDDYRQFLATTLGVEGAYNLTGQELEDAIDARMEALEFANPEDAANVMTNAAVLYAAQNTAPMTSTDVTALLGTGNAEDIIKGNLNSDPGTAMAQAALAYGVYSSYCYATGQEDVLEESTPLDIMHALDDAEFLAYVNNTPTENSTWTAGQAANDINGYLSALNMINTSTNASGSAAIDVLATGFGTDNAELYALLSGMIGQ